MWWSPVFIWAVVYGKDYKLKSWQEERGEGQKEDEQVAAKLQSSGDWWCSWWCWPYDHRWDFTDRIKQKVHKMFTMLSGKITIWAGSWQKQTLLNSCTLTRASALKTYSMLQLVFRLSATAFWLCTWLNSKCIVRINHLDTKTCK